jgi:hypothetical protein
VAIDSDGSTLEVWHGIFTLQISGRIRLHWPVGKSGRGFDLLKPALKALLGDALPRAVDGRVDS